MEVGDRKANAVLLGGHPTVFSEQFDIWGLGRVVLWASDFAKVISTSELLRLFEPKNDIIPRIDILRVWKAHEVIGNFSVLLNLCIEIFFSHSGFSVESHLSGVFHFVVFKFSVNYLLFNKRVNTALK